MSQGLVEAGQRYAKRSLGAPKIESAIAMFHSIDHPADQSKVRYVVRVPIRRDRQFRPQDDCLHQHNRQYDQQTETVLETCFHWFHHLQTLAIQLRIPPNNSPLSRRILSVVGASGSNRATSRSKVPPSRIPS